MRILLAGATGVVGRQLVPLLVAAGHAVVASTRTSGKQDALAAQGAEPVVLDLLDAAAVRSVVLAARPDAIVHEATALSALGNNLRRFDSYFAQTNRLRTVGTRALLDAAREAGVGRFVAQSYCGWPFATQGPPALPEDAPLETDPPKGFRQVLAAIVELERLVTGVAGGVVLRYGGLYGPGTSLDEGGAQLQAVRRRQFPVVGDGGGYWSFLHVADAASAAAAALERGSGIYNVVDDEPAPVAEWLPALAAAVGAKPPRHVPAWLGRLLAGDVVVEWMTHARGVSNAKAKRVLDWRPRWTSWREGFRHALVEPATRPREAAA